MIVLEFLWGLFLEFIGGIVMSALIQVILWPLRKLRQLAFLAIAAVDRHFSG